MSDSDMNDLARVAGGAAVAIVINEALEAHRTPEETPAGKNAEVHSIGEIPFSLIKCQYQIFQSTCCRAGSRIWRWLSLNRRRRQRR